MVLFSQTEKSRELSDPDVYMADVGIPASKLSSFILGGFNG
jgi:hypothetical protein